MALTVDVQVACDDPDIPSPDDLSRWTELALLESGRASTGDVEIAVRVVDSDEIRTLNRLYRDSDKPTNVLSFPAGRLEGLPADAGELLGDVVICAAVVADEARTQGKPLAAHWAHMMVHGTLHLLGFDHESEPEAHEMEALEARILALGNVTDPYAG